ncbi:glycosyltransferase [Alistipes sp.]|uniref:glycosyltransferase n=1 Tax=Alistipes sp. TaxID=1872444 RepID=UPI003AEFBB76
MKILHTISGLNVNSGGPTSCTYNLIKELRRNGVEADVLTIKPRAGTGKIVGTDHFIKAVENDARTPYEYSKNFKLHLESNTNYELYHGNGLWTYPTHITAKIARKFGKPCIIAPHGMLYPQGLAVSPFKKKLALTLFQRHDLETAVCLQATCLDELQHIRACNLKTPVAIIPNGLPVSTDLIPRLKTNNTRRFAFVGRINRIKNIDRLLVAWQKLGNKTRDCELLIIGEGDEIYKNELLAYVATHHLENVHFTGFISGDALSRTVRTLDYQVLPSKSENFGMVVPEALILGVPVIASTGTPWKELDTYRCGWWIANDPDTLADALHAAIHTSETERLAMGERGRTLVMEKYSIESVSHNMIALYKWILEGGSMPEFISL